MTQSDTVEQSNDEPIILRFDASHRRIDKKKSDEQTLGQFIPLIYHYNMLQDTDRVGGFRQAIELLVQPGMRVAELGSGTGILSSFAARRGATVEAVERNPELVKCSRQLIQSNGLQKQIKVIAEDASLWIPTEPIDVVICEMLHVGLLREKQAQVITAFKEHYQKRFGNKLPIFIPEVSILMCQPVEQSFDFAGYVAPIPMFQAPVETQPRTKQVAPLTAYQTIAYDQAIPTAMRVDQTYEANCDAVVNAIRLVTQNVLAIDMSKQHAITWANQCLVLPLDSAFSCRTGETVHLSLEYEAGQQIESVRYSVSPMIRRMQSRAA
ncbi:MAG TPA: methyltransferase [Planctomycetaceae bacterium]|nr:methyltransferase [Planctomycetaceae bacterium]